jgi:VIT1/CCC1 family predicted Fe2+/Mn2+ transporter
MLVNAIRDYDYVQNMGTYSEKDAAELQRGLKNAFGEIFLKSNKPYKTRYRFLKEDQLDGLDVIHWCLRKILPRSWSYSKEEKRRRVSEYYIDKKSPSGSSDFVDGCARFFVALASGASLIVPMVIMTLNKSKTRSLVTTSVAVLLVAIFVSFGIKAKNSDIIQATVAYAAVLVVFVAVSNP